jgi:hypothetical protein
MLYKDYWGVYKDFIKTGVFALGIAVEILFACFLQKD